jgi:hypothetical protein
MVAEPRAVSRQQLHQAQRRLRRCLHQRRRLAAILLLQHRANLWGASRQQASDDNMPSA